MIENLKPKEATSIINSLLGGVVPVLGIQHITVGRDEEVKSILRSLEDVKNGQSLFKFWIGDFGSGKSFMLHLLNTVAIKQKFVVANADFTPDNRLYANDGKSVALYSAIIDNLSIQTKPEGGALSTILDKWIEQIQISIAHEKSISILDVRDKKYDIDIQKKIMEAVNQLTDVGGFDFGAVVYKYYEGYSKGNDNLKKSSLRWLKGEYKTKTEARSDLGVREIINDQNYYDMLKNFCNLFVHIGYNGFMINLDEAVNLYKISTSTMREKNYEKLLSMYNDCFQGKVSHLFFNVAATKETLENERRGFFSYSALKTRLAINQYESAEFRDYSQPVIRLFPLSHTEVFVLLQKLKWIFDSYYETQLDFTEDDIHRFMEDIYNQPGSSEFLTPREVIRDFLNILNILRQNPGLDKNNLFADVIVKDERPKDSELEEY